MLKKVSCYNSLEVLESVPRTESNCVVTLIFVLLETLPRLNRSSSSTFASSYLVLSTPLARVLVRLVLLLQYAKTSTPASTVLKLELLCLLIMEFAVSMSSTKWTQKIKLRSTKLWNSRQFLLPRRAFTPLLTQEPQSWLLRIPCSADTTDQSPSDTTLTSHHPLCLVSISSLSFLMRKTTMKTKQLPNTSSTCTQ
jgi:hypothetical protein